MESNVQKMREALEMMIFLFDKEVICTSYANTPEEMVQIEELYRKAKSALSIPLRNCNVGTADEQEERFKAFCNAHSCSECPARGGWRSVYIDGTSFKMIQCGVKWAQMPYEEGGAK